MIPNLFLQFVIMLVIAGLAAIFLWVRALRGTGGKKCSARHILMKTEEDLLKVKARIDAGEDFSKIAAECSVCPSGKNGGSVGEFAPDTMVPAFDNVCFDPATEIGKVNGPIQTEFGYHLIIVDTRSGSYQEHEKKTN